VGASCYYFNYSTSFVLPSFLFLDFIKQLPSIDIALFLSRVISLYFNDGFAFIIAFTTSSIAYALLIFRLHHEFIFQLALKCSCFP